MKNKKNLNNTSYFKLSSNPKGTMESKKSYRTTFNLTTEAVEGLKWLQKTHKITTKEIFDHVVEEIEAFSDAEARGITIPEGCLDLEDIIGKIKKHPRQPNDCPRKTYVLSLGALLVLKDTSQKLDFSRDDMISKIIEYIVDKEKTRREINREKYKEAYEILSEFKTSLWGTWNRLSEILGDDDIAFDVSIIFDSSDITLQPVLEKLEKLTKEE